MTENSATTSKVFLLGTDSIDAVKRVLDYLNEKNAALKNEVEEYLYPRIIWGMAMNYSVGGCLDLLK